MAAKRYSIIFYAAIVVALVATFGVYRVLEKTKENARVVTRPVVVAQRDIAEGAAIDPMAVVVAQWPVYTIPAGAFTSIDSVAGRVARMTVFKGEVLVPGRLAPDGTGPGLEVKITPGKRAVSFRINDVSGIAGLIQPDGEGNATESFGVPADLAAPAGMAVSLEPDGGVPAPTGAIYLATQ